MVGHSQRCTTRESTFTACFLPLFALFPRWDRTGCLKQSELDKGRERKTILWSTNNKFQTPPPPHLHRPLFRVWPLFRFWTPPPPPPPLLRTDRYSGLTLIPGSTLVLPWPKKLKQARKLTQAKHRRVHARQITRLGHVRVAVSIFLAMVVVILPWPKKSLQPRYSWGWSAVRSCDIELRFDIDATHSTARRELALQIEVDVAWYHMIALRINLMNISAVTIFLARVVEP